MLSKPWKAEKWVFDFISPQRRGIRRSRDRPPNNRVLFTFHALTKISLLVYFRRWNFRDILFQSYHPIKSTLLNFFSGWFASTAVMVVEISQTDFLEFSLFGENLFLCAEYIFWWLARTIVLLRPWTTPPKIPTMEIFHQHLCKLGSSLKEGGHGGRGHSKALKHNVYLYLYLYICICIYICIYL